MVKQLKKHLPLVQFIAVILTIFIGIHTAINRFFEPSTDPIAFTNDVIRMVEGPTQSSYSIILSYALLRHDCILDATEIKITDVNGLTYDTTSSSPTFLRGNTWKINFKLTTLAKREMGDDEYIVNVGLDYKCPAQGSVYLQHPTVFRQKYTQKEGFLIFSH